MTEVQYDPATGDLNRFDIRELLDDGSTIRKNLAWLQDLCSGDAEAAGWHSDYPQPKQFTNPEGDSAFDAACRAWDASKVALVHSEVSEGMEELRKGDNVTPLYYVIPEFPDEHYTEPQFRDGVMVSKPEGIAAEYADAIIRMMDHAGVNGWDLPKAIGDKLLYNRGRGFRHGGRAL